MMPESVRQRIKLRCTVHGQEWGLLLRFGTRRAGIGAIMKSPSHRSHPNHKVEEERVEDPLTVMVDGHPVAHSHDVIRVTEDGYADRYYFSRSDVQLEALKPTPKTTECPFKGTANYFDLHMSEQFGGRTLKNIVWSYENPYEGASPVGSALSR